MLYAKPWRDDDGKVFRKSNGDSDPPNFLGPTSPLFALRSVPGQPAGITVKLPL